MSRKGKGNNPLGLVLGSRKLRRLEAQGKGLNRPTQHGPVQQAAPIFKKEANK